MQMQTKKGLLIAAALVIVGLALVIGAVTLYRWDSAKPAEPAPQGTTQSTAPAGDGKLITSTHEIKEAFQNISLNTETADIVFAPSEDGSAKVVCTELEDYKHTVSVQNDTLTISADRKWRDYIGNGLRLAKEKIHIYLPESDYASLSIREDTGDIQLPEDFRFEAMDISVSTGNVLSAASVTKQIKIETETGDIDLQKLSASSLDLDTSTGKMTLSDITCSGDVELEVSTGKVNLTNVSCQNLRSEGSTGKLYLKNVIASEKLELERSTGSIELEGCDAAQLSIESDTGDISGSLLSDKVFVAKSSMGKVEVPSGSSGGRCEIKSDTGDIRIVIQ